MNRIATAAARTGRLLRSSAPLSARASSSATSVPAAQESTGTAVPATKQSPNYPSAWSTSQRSRAEMYEDARFEQTSLELQPQPLSAMELIAQEPVRMVNGRIAECDGGASSGQVPDLSKLLVLTKPSFFRHDPACVTCLSVFNLLPFALLLEPTLFRQRPAGSPEDFHQPRESHKSAFRLSIQFKRP